MLFVSGKWCCVRCSDRFKSFVNSKSTEGFHFSLLRQNGTFLWVWRCVHRVLLVGYAPVKVASYIDGIFLIFIYIFYSSLAKIWVMQVISRSIQNFLVVRKLRCLISHSTCLTSRWTSLVWAECSTQLIIIISVLSDPRCWHALLASWSTQDWC